jgi:hypothetical protein
MLDTLVKFAPIRKGQEGSITRKGVLAVRKNHSWTNLLIGVARKLTVSERCEHMCKHEIIILLIIIYDSLHYSVTEQMSALV